MYHVTIHLIGALRLGDLWIQPGVFGSIGGFSVLDQVSVDVEVKKCDPHTTAGYVREMSEVRAVGVYSCQSGGLCVDLIEPVVR